MERYLELNNCIVDYGSGEILLADAYVNNLNQYCISITFKSCSPVELPYGKEPMDKVRRDKDFITLKERLATLEYLYVIDDNIAVRSI